MKNICALVALVVATFVCGCTTSKTTAPKPTVQAGLPAYHITLTVSCSDPKMEFIGTIVEDDRSRKVSGKGGGTYRVSGSDIVAIFKKSSGPGQLSLQGSEAGVSVGNTSTSQESGVVRADFHSNPEHKGFSSF